MRVYREKVKWMTIYLICLLLFTVYILLDSFVIARVYTVAEPSALPSPMVTAAGGGITGQAAASAGNPDIAPFTYEPVLTDTTYSDERIYIEITTERRYESTIYVAKVQLADASQLKTAFADNAYGRNIRAQTSTIAEENGAIFAVNGDYYGARSEGYVVRNGTLYRDRADSGNEALVIWQDGTFEIIIEGETDAAELVERGAAQVFSFGPALVTNGEVLSEGDTSGITRDNPRTAIGMVDNLHYVFIVADGRTDESQGLSTYELATLMYEMGARTAYNLDGGGSAAMFFNGETVNVPTADGEIIRERRVSDIVYISPTVTTQ